MSSSKKAAISTPILVVADLRHAYESISKARPLKNNPILSFTLLESYIYRRFSRPTPTARELAVIDMLYDVLIENLVQFRRNYGLSEPDLTANADAILAEIADDVKTGNRLLVGFSFLYHRYLRYDLDMDVAQLSSHYGLTARHMRRLNNDTLHHLAQDFVQRELDHRAAMRYHRAKLALPDWHYVSVASQDNLIKSLIARIEDSSGPLLLWGPPGIGKSIIAIETANRILDRRLVHDAVYIDLNLHETGQESARLAAIVAEALQLPLDQPSHESISTFLAIQRELEQEALLIIDQADGWLMAMVENWQWLGHMTALVTSRTPISQWLGMSRQCVELNESDALLLLQDTDPDGIHAGAYRQIYQFVGGNPQRLRQALQVIDKLPLDAGLLYQTVFEQTQTNWHQLDVISQQLWILIDFISVPEHVPYTSIREAAEQMLGLPIESLNAALHQLVDHHLLAVIPVTENHYVYHIELATLQAIAATEQYRRLAPTLGSVIDDPALIVRVLERLAQQRLPIEEIERLIVVARQHIAETGQWQRWLSILDRLQTISAANVTPALALQKIIALRWVGQLQEAADLCQQTLAQCRQSGDIYHEIEVLIELATIEFYLGNVDQALQGAEAAAQLLESGTFDVHLRDRVILALAQTQYKRDAHRAYQLLETVEQVNANYWDMLARIELQLGRVGAALQATQNAVDLAQGQQHPSQLRALGLLAQVLAALDNYPDALHQFASTINRMQVSHDAIGLARMYTNYGITCARYAETLSPQGSENLRIRNAHLDMARESLRRALRLYEFLQDDEGQQTAEQTLYWVKFLRNQ